jgi:glycerol uptake facilitator-like aquaporin
MTFGEVVLPVIVQLAYGVAVAAVQLMLWYVRRRYPTAPKRNPLRLRFDGRPSERTGPRRWLWAAPIALALIMIVLTGFLFAAPPAPDQRVPIALVFVIMAEIAWFTGWTTDRQIELARGMTYRIAPARTLRAFLPILATIALTLFIAIRPS